MTNSESEITIQRAELKRIEAETARLNSEREKLDEEKKAILSQNSKRWWNLRASGLIQSVIAGVVAGALVAGFGLDHFLKVTELNEKSRDVLAHEKSEVEAENAKLAEREAENKRIITSLEKREEENRQTLTSLHVKNSELKGQVKESLEKIKMLTMLSKGNNEDDLNSEIALLKVELERVESDAESREQSLSTELKNLTKGYETTSTEPTNNWFPVIASPYNQADLNRKLQEFESKSPKYPMHVYETADRHGTPVYAITLGGYLTKEEAKKRVSYARSTKLAPDAYRWRSNIWGIDVRNQMASAN